MPVKKFMFQQGNILNEVVVGAFRSRGTTLSKWCSENGVSTSHAQNALRGTSSGKVGIALAERLIDAAGREVVEVAYKSRIRAHAQEIGSAA